MLTQTRPLPPPGAGVALATASAFSCLDALLGATEAAGLGEPFGLNKSANVFLGEPAGLAAGEPAVAGVAIAVFFRALFEAGSVTGWVVLAGEALAAGEASAVSAAFSFLRDFFAGEADASGLVPGEASAALSSFFFRDFLVGEADASAPADALASGEAAGLASAFLCDLCLAGDSSGVGEGDWAFAEQTAAAKPSATSKMRYFVFMLQC